MQVQVLFTAFPSVEAVISGSQPLFLGINFVMRWRHMNAVPLRKTACSAWSIAVGLLLLCPHLSIADEDQVAQQPGLHCILTDGQHSVVRVDRGLNLDWSDGPPAR